MTSRRISIERLNPICPKSAIRAVFPHDPRQLAEMGFVADDRLNYRDLLEQACGPCHNERLDQTLSRARFNIDRMSADEKQIAIQRLQLPSHHNLAVPPATSSA